MYIQVREFGSELSRSKILKVASINCSINDLKELILDQLHHHPLSFGHKEDAKRKRRRKRRRKDEDDDDENGRRLSSNGKEEKEEEIRIFFDGKEVTGHLIH